MLNNAFKRNKIESQFQLKVTNIPVVTVIAFLNILTLYWGASKDTLTITPGDTPFIAELTTASTAASFRVGSFKSDTTILYPHFH